MVGDIGSRMDSMFVVIACVAVCGVIVALGAIVAGGLLLFELVTAAKWALSAGLGFGALAAVVTAVLE